YNAGMDAHEDCSFGGLRGMNDDIVEVRERTVFEWSRSMNLPVAFVLAGGYEGGEMTREHLIRLHRYTIEAAADA
ncbi:MAG: hypothetical protein L0Y66_25070, partial [Myxococcaceae bacterium]|nr:hypothetical protein [Myxococcaceae bacterium]